MSRGDSTSVPHVPRCAMVRELCAGGPVVLPSMLMCDFGNLAREVERLEEAGVKALHLDVMDGHFVPNLTYGLTIVETLRKLTDLPLDAHLMIDNPAEYVVRYVEAGADLVTVHVEAADDPSVILERIRELGAAAGLAINPPTPIGDVLPLVDLCDMVLIMGVMPGFGGQAFDRRAIEKLEALRDRYRAPVNHSKKEKVQDRSLLLQVDGGVNDNTIAECVAAGADLLVVGSAIFAQNDYGEPIRRLAQLAHGPLSNSGNLLEKTS